MKWYITGDTHGTFTRFYELDEQTRRNSNIAIIILGDAGWNFFLNKSDTNRKKDFHENCNFYVYCVRGNHEARPQSLPNLVYEIDKNVNGWVMYERNFPRIRYFLDYGGYEINGLKTLVIGGAYSVDKGYRLARAGFASAEVNDPKYSGWWNDEQLSPQEMLDATFLAHSREWDLVLTHTCPYSWEPRDLFLSMVDQSNVDDTMERWMEQLRCSISWNIWLFGHFHEDRLIRPHVEMLFNDIEPLDDIIKRWNYWDEHGELDAWWYHKDDNFYKEDENIPEVNIVFEQGD